jgi:hypothetical protein
MADKAAKTSTVAEQAETTPTITTTTGPTTQPPAEAVTSAPTAAALQQHALDIQNAQQTAQAARAMQNAATDAAKAQGRVADALEATHVEQGARTAQVTGAVAVHAPRRVRPLGQAGPNDSIAPIGVNLRASTPTPEEAINPAAARVNATIPTSPAAPDQRVTLADDQDVVGRIVRYVLPKGSPFTGELRAAIVTRTLQDGTVNLTVFKGEQLDFVGADVQILDNGGIVGMLSGVRHSDTLEPGTFHAA